MFAGDFRTESKPLSFEAAEQTSKSNSKTNTRHRSHRGPQQLGFVAGVVARIARITGRRAKRRQNAQRRFPCREVGTRIREQATELLSC